MTDLAPVQEQTPAQALVQRLDQPNVQRQLVALLPEDVKPQRFVRSLATALIDHPEIAEAEFHSLMSALLKCAQDGLLPDNRDAAIGVFKGKAQYMPMVGGYRKVAAEYGWTIEADVVYEHDEFSVTFGVNSDLVHRKVRPGAEKGALIAAYAIGRRHGFATLFEVVYQDQIDEAKKSSRTAQYESSPWNRHEASMWKKTAVRRLFPQLALGGERAHRLALIEDGGTAAEALYGPQEERAALPAAPADKTASAGAQDPAQDHAADAQGPEEAAAHTGGDAEPPAPPPVVEHDGSDQGHADRAATVKFEDGGHEGATIEEVFNSKDGGPGYLRFYMSRGKNPIVKEACRRYAKVYMPDVYHEVVGKEEIASGNA